MQKLPELTPMQRRIVQLAAMGLADKEIAGSVGIAYRTVRTHLERLYDRHQVHSKAALVGLLASSAYAEPTAEPAEHQPQVSSRATIVVR